VVIVGIFGFIATQNSSCGDVPELVSTLSPNPLISSPSCAAEPAAHWWWIPMFWVAVGCAGLYGLGWTSDREDRENDKEVT